MPSKLADSSVRLHDALSLWRFFWNYRAGEIVASNDFRFGVPLGAAVGIALCFVHSLSIPSSVYTMVVSFFSITGGFLAASVSILVGQIRSRFVESDRLQYLKIIFDYIFCVAIVLLTALSWIVYAALHEAARGRIIILSDIARAFLVMLSIYSILAVFFALNRLFRIAGLVLIGEEIGEVEGQVK